MAKQEKKQLNLSGDQGQAGLIEGIKKDAEVEAKALVDSAQKFLTERREATARRLEKIKTEAEQKLARQVGEIRKSILSSLTVEKRRITLKVREQLVAQVTAKVKEALVKKITQPDYTNIICDWLVEGAMGLNAKAVEVNASADEKALITDELLAAVAAKVKHLTGRDLKLSLDPQPPLLSQGVSLTTIGGRTAFNNQVETRLLRSQSQIRKIIYDALFKSE